MYDLARTARPPREESYFHGRIFCDGPGVSREFSLSCKSAVHSRSEYSDYSINSIAKIVIYAIFHRRLAVRLSLERLEHSFR